MLTALIGGGLSLLSSFGAAKSAKSQARRQQAMNEAAQRENQYQLDLAQEHNTALGERLLKTPAFREGGVDVDAMMLDAERAGFNPVTWLQNGALQAYSWNAETQPAEAFRMMMRTPLQTQAGTAANIPSALQAVGDAGKAALNIYRQDAAAEESQNFQRELLQMRLDQVQGNGGSFGGSLGGSMFGSIPRITTSGPATTTTTKAALAERGFEEDQAKVTPNIFGRNSWWQNDQRWPNADSVTGVYGEGADWSYGPLKFGNDLMLNTTRGVGLNRGQGIGFYDVMDMATASAGMWRDQIGAPRPWVQRALQGFNLDGVFRNPNRSQPWLGSGM